MSATPSSSGVGRCGSVAGGAPESATPPSPSRETRTPVRPISAVSLAWGTGEGEAMGHVRVHSDTGWARRACQVVVAPTGFDHPSRPRSRSARVPCFASCARQGDVRRGCSTGKARLWSTRPSLTLSGVWDRSLASSSTALLCFISLCSCFSVGAFSPQLPEIGRAGALADWQLGVVAGALGFARMATAIPAGWLAGRYLGTTLCASPALMLAGTVLLATSSSFSVLVLGRLILIFAYTLGTVSGLIALLLDDRGPGASVRLNIFEFSAMIGVLGGLGLVGLLPGHWGWSLSLLIASSPLLLILAAVPSIRRRFPDASRAPETRASRTSDVGRGDRMSVTLWTMFAVGIVLALAWSAVSQFLLPLRGTREFGLDRGGVSGLLMLAQLVDLGALLPVGRLADGLGRTPVLGFVI